MTGKHRSQIKHSIARQLRGADGWVPAIILIAAILIAVMLVLTFSEKPHKLRADIDENRARIEAIEAGR